MQLGSKGLPIGTLGTFIMTKGRYAGQLTLSKLYTRNTFFFLNTSCSPFVYTQYNE